MKKIFFGTLKLLNILARICIWIRIHIRKSKVRIRGSGSLSKCHGSGTLLLRYRISIGTVQLGTKVPMIRIRFHIVDFRSRSSNL